MNDIYKKVGTGYWRYITGIGSIILITANILTFDVTAGGFVAAFFITMFFVLISVVPYIIMIPFLLMDKSSGFKEMLRDMQIRPFTYFIITRRMYTYDPALWLCIYAFALWTLYNDSLISSFFSFILLLVVPFFYIGVSVRQYFINYKKVRDRMINDIVQDSGMAEPDGEMSPEMGGKKSRGKKDVRGNIVEVPQSGVAFELSKFDELEILAAETGSKPLKESVDVLIEAYNILKEFPAVGEKKRIAADYMKELGMALRNYNNIKKSDINNVVSEEPVISLVSDMTKVIYSFINEANIERSMENNIRMKALVNDMKMRGLL